VVDGNRLDRVFDINPLSTAHAGFTVTFKNFTIRNGFASAGTGPSADSLAATGGGVRDQGNVNLTLTNMVVTHNRSTADGGGIVMADSVNLGWNLKITNSIISNNNSGDAGGGIDTDGGTGTVTITNSIINNNTDL